VFTSRLASQPIFLSILCSPHGGIATYVLGLLEAQSSHGSAIALAYTCGRADPAFTFKVGSLASLTSRTILHLQTHKLPTFKSISDLVTLLIFCREHTSARDVVLIAHGTSSAGLALVVSLLFKRCRFFYIPHGGVSHLYNSKNPLLRLCVFLYDKLLSSLGARFLCESRYTYDLYSSLSSSNPYLFVEPYGYVYSLPQDLLLQIGAKRLSSSRSHALGLSSPVHEDPFTIIYLGTWRVIKGAVHLLRVLELMGPQHATLPNGRPIRFMLYTDLACSCKFSLSEDGPKVSFHPWSSDVPSVLRSADAQIIPSRGESFGYAAIEALAARVPIIHTNVGGLKEILSGTFMPILSVDFTASDLYRAILNISSNSFDQLLGPSDPLQGIVDRSFWAQHPDFLSSSWS